MPAAGGLANLCLVTAGGERVPDPGARLWRAVRQDPALRDRCARARQVAAAVMLGPLAVDARAAGVPGLLLAGDAAGFIDPMTGDGLYLALRGGRLAADVLLHATGLDDEAIVARLGQDRRAALGAKLRFNRVVRTLVGWPLGLRLGAMGAAWVPSALRHVIAMAGDVGAARRATA